jgi:hypothetical protein
MFLILNFLNCEQEKKRVKKKKHIYNLTSKYFQLQFVTYVTKQTL